MRWDGGGDGGADGGDDVDDDPDDARHDGDDDGGGSPLREGNFSAVFSLPELFVSLSGFRLVEAEEKFFVDTPDFFRSKVNNTPKGRRRGATGTRAGPCRDPRWACGRGSHLSPVAHLFAPFWFCDLFP